LLKAFFRLSLAESVTSHEENLDAIPDTADIDEKESSRSMLPQAMKRPVEFLCLATLLFTTTSCGRPATGESSLAVPQFGRFETAILHDRSYDDPFRDVTLDLTFTRPDGRQVAFWGFYDGGDSWRIRFMPDQPGVWQYEATFSDGSGTASGSFTCVKSDVPSLLGKDNRNPVWFGYRSGAPLLIRGFHVGDRFFAANWPDEKRAAFLDWASEQGYNLLSIASHYLNRDEDGRGRGWDTPDLWDSQHRRPNPREYTRMEIILDELARRGISVYPFAGFFGKSSLFPTDHGDQELYIRYTLARIGPSWNLLLNVAGPEPLQVPETHRRYQGAMEAEDIRRLGALVDSLNPFGHLVSIHNRPGDDPFREEPWAGFTTLQGAQDNGWNAIHEFVRRNATGTRPVFAQEVFWPGNSLHQVEGRSRDLNETEIRKKAFTLLFSGAAINFGDMNGNSSSGFSGSMDLAERNQPRHDVVREVWDWFETLPFYRMRPRPELASGGFALAQDGVRYAAYFPTVESVATLDLSGVDAAFTLRWYDPRSGRYENAPEVRGGGLVSLHPPTSGMYEDWVVLLEREEIPVHTETEGVIAIEAEQAVYRDGWIEVDGVSGSAMRDEGERGRARIAYNVRFDEPGRYYVYMLMRRTDLEHSDKANDAFVLLGGRKLYASDDVTRPDGIRCSQQEFSWESMPKGPGAHTPRHIFHDPIYALVPAPGEYTLEVISRSRGFEIDQIRLQREGLARPE
jgi:hypothetical protein